MKIPCLSRPYTRVSRHGIARWGGAGSLATAIADKKRQPGASRYTRKNETPCASCAKGKHGCKSIHCPCPKCNPEVV